VGSCIRSRIVWLGVPDERLSLDGAGERGKIGSSGENTGVGGTRTGKVVVEGGGDSDGDGDADAERDGDDTDD
jgi:hypothetical protein